MNKNKVLFLLMVGVMSVFLLIPNVFADTVATEITIDLPSEGSSYVDSVYLAGWVMSEVNNKVRVSIDDNDVTGSIVRNEREDVLNLIKGYGDKSTNPTPGFTGTIDLSSYDYGKHTIKVEALDSEDKVLKEKSVIINKKAPETEITIDLPSEGSSYVDSVYLAGWVMSEVNNKVRVSIDDNDVTGSIVRNEREDVLNLIKGYGDKSTNPTPGFTGTIDLSSYDYGKHTIKVEALDGENKVLKEVTRVFENKKPMTKLNIDNPVSDANRNLLISGWVMSETINKKIKVYLDDAEITSPLIDDERPDVLKAIKGYGDSSTNKAPGFSEIYDLTDYKDGKHTIKIAVISSNGEIIASESRFFTLEKYKNTINITSPTNSTYKTSLDISGYVLSEAPNFSLDLYIDNNLIASNINRTNDNNINSDLYDKYGGSSINNLPNFYYTYNTSGLTDGNHIIKVALVLPSGEIIYSNEQKINIKKYSGTITLDYPQATNVANNSQIYITGWEMSEDVNSTVEVYLDGKLQNVDISTFYREDVINIIKDYGGLETNPHPGFSTYLTLTNQSDGYHTLTIKTKNNMGEVIATYDKQLYLYSGFSLGIDVSEYNGNINWSAVKNSGGVDFAFIRLGFRGYGAPGNFKLDSRFVENVNNAYAAGIKTGIYLFDQAITYQEGVEEADYIIQNFNMNPGMKDKITLPIVLDVENSTSPTGDGRADKISNEQRTEAVRGFIDRMNQYGYKPLIYANYDYLTNKLNLSKWSNYDIWLAHWTYDFNKLSDYKGSYTYWQYHNCGSIVGINGCVDLDLSYEK